MRINFRVPDQPDGMAHATILRRLPESGGPPNWHRQLWNNSPRPREELVVWSTNTFERSQVMPLVSMSGKMCIVTGANSGIGKETALGLARSEEHTSELQSLRHLV